MLLYFVSTTRDSARQVYIK